MITFTVTDSAMNNFYFVTVDKNRCLVGSFYSRNCDELARLLAALGGHVVLEFGDSDMCSCLERALTRNKVKWS
jgi:predicted DNA-binding WGR domain protein